MFNDPPADPANPNPGNPNPAPNPNPTPKTFTQDEVNRMMAENKKNLQQTNQKLIADLEKMKEQTNLTQQQREQLETQIQELTTQFQTKEEMLKDSTKKMEERFNKEKNMLSSERDHWKTQFQTTEITRSIQDASTAAEAFNAQQIVDILYPKTRLVEEKVGDKSKYVSKVKFPSTDASGNIVELDLTVPEAITKMKEDSARFGNLFKSGAAGGIGGQGNQLPTNAAGDADLSKMSFEQYQEWRKKEGLDKVQ
jgi:hypothetical protein